MADVPDDTSGIDQEFWDRVRDRADGIAKMPATLALSAATVVGLDAGAASDPDSAKELVLLAIGRVGTKTARRRSWSSRRVLATVGSQRLAEHKLFAAEHEASNSFARLRQAEAAVEDLPPWDRRALLSTPGYWALQAVVLLGEFVVARRAMVPLRLAGPLDAVVALSVVFAIVAIGHVVGTALGRARTKDRKASSPEPLVSSLAGIGALQVLVLGWLASMSQHTSTAPSVAAGLLYTLLGSAMFVLAIVGATYRYDPMMAAIVRSRQRMQRADRRLQAARRRAYRARTRCSTAANRRRMLAAQCVLEADLVRANFASASGIDVADPPWLEHERLLAGGQPLQDVVDEVQLVQTVVVEERQSTGVSVAEDDEPAVGNSQRNLG